MAQSSLLMLEFPVVVKRVVPMGCENDMIQKRVVHQFRSLCDFLGDVSVGLTWPWFSARVIVRDDERRCSKCHQGAKEQLHVHLGRGHHARGEDFESRDLV